MVGCRKQSGLVYTNIIHVALNYRHILYIEVAYTNYFAGSLNIYIGKTLVFNFGALFSYLFVDKKPYYNSGLSLNKSIDLTNIGL
jgi:hypothetical protein